MPDPARAAARVPLRALLWTLLGGWIGALLLFGLGVTRTAFVVVPDPEIAAHLVGSLLGPLQLSGMALGVGLAALGGWLRRGWLAVALPLLLALVCAANHFGVSPAVAAIRIGDPGADPEAGARFARLHQLSVGLFGATALGALLLLLVHLRAELREEHPARR